MPFSHPSLGLCVFFLSFFHSLQAAENAEKREIVDRRTYGHMCQSAHEWVCEQFRKTVRPGSHTAGLAGRLWSEVAVASLKHPWDNKMRLPDENGGKDRRATFDDVAGVTM